jgi:hypothetical protein
MARCEVCGNDYDKAFEVRAGGGSHTFDSFGCAIHGSRHSALTADGESSDMGSKPEVGCSDARAAHGRAVCQA